MSEILIPFDAKIDSVPIHKVNPETISRVTKSFTPSQNQWIKNNDFAAKPQSICQVPGNKGNISCVLFGQPSSSDRLGAGILAQNLPAGTYCLGQGFKNKFQDTLAFGLGGYKFQRYKSDAKSDLVKLVVDKSLDFDQLNHILHGVIKTRDLINIPAIDMGPAELSSEAKKLILEGGGKFKVYKGNEILKKEFPLIYAVGQASDRNPRLIDATWGDKRNPKVTLVGKGVCYDTGGLNLKPGNSMSLMKKDMGGAANVLGLAAMIMASALKIRLRVLIPVVENSVSSSSFRPGDIFKSRKGLTVEIGNTDAEGRLVLADALDLADEDAPELIVDMATLTGAARVALGAEVVPFYTHDDKLANGIFKHSRMTEDPTWRMPLWSPYLKLLDSKAADLNNISSGSFAGSVTAALFLSKFVSKAKSWIHFDIYGWIPSNKPYGPEGGEAQGIRALFSYLQERYGT